jgi:hypothetical protein
MREPIEDSFIIADAAGFGVRQLAAALLLAGKPTILITHRAIRGTIRKRRHGAALHRLRAQPRRYSAFILLTDRELQLGEESRAAPVLFSRHEITGGQGNNKDEPVSLQTDEELMPASKVSKHPPWRREPEPWFSIASDRELQAFLHQELAHARTNRARGSPAPEPEAPAGNGDRNLDPGRRVQGRAPNRAGRNASPALKRGGRGLGQGLGHDAGDCCLRALRPNAGLLVRTGLAGLAGGAART